MIDSNGNTVNAFGIPTGPIDRDPTAAYDSTGEFKGAGAQEAILLDTLRRAGVELGSHDERIVRWLSEVADWSTFATVASWIERAIQADPLDTDPGATLAPPAPGLHRVVAGPYVVDYAADGEHPRQIWHVTDRAVTEIPEQRWTPRLLEQIKQK